MKKVDKKCQNCKEYSITSKWCSSLMMTVGALNYCPDFKQAGRSEIWHRARRILGGIENNGF